MARNKVKLSVIVPCYNVEDYIDRNITSLCEQTMENIEIIAINDGSSDKTGEKLEKLAKKYKNLVVIQKQNEGVSKTRNMGLDLAKGEYVTFLDSDDWVEKDCYFKLYMKAKEGDYDIVACNTTALYSDHELIIKSGISNESRPNELLINAYAVIWNKIYKKDILENIRFNEKMSFCEDVLFLYMVYSKVKKVAAIDEELHYYSQREGSLSYTYSKNLYQVIDCMDEVIKYYKSVNLYKKYEEELEYSYVRYLYATFIKRLSKTKNKQEFNKGYEFVRKKVKEKFPDYKKNKYLKKLCFKNFYIKNFNKLLANLIFVIKKDKAN